MPHAHPTRRQRRIAYAACACALAYGLMKVWMAARGEVGMLGFPPSANASTDRIGLRQLGNAIFGFLAAALALIVVSPWRRPLPRALLLVVLWGGGLALAAGASSLALRASRLVAVLGPPPSGATGLIVAGMGVLWASLWIALAWGYTRGRY